MAALISVGAALVSTNQLKAQSGRRKRPNVKRHCRSGCTTNNGPTVATNVDVRFAPPL